jgi:hypothetical protein
MKKDYAIVKTNKKREDKGEKSHTTVEKNCRYERENEIQNKIIIKCE